MTKDTIVPSYAWKLILTLVVAVSMALPSFASAATWANEDAMRESTLYRDTFVYDPGLNHTIPRSAFVQAPLAGYYEERGFNANFLNWAHVQEANLGAAEWSGCNPGSHPQPCPASSIHWSVVGASIGSGRLTVLTSGGAFISIVCGNYSRSGSGGPTPPRISGVKYEDMNANGKRDSGEPGLSGWTIKLRYEGKVVASTTTASDGGYSFTLDAVKLHVGAGKYQVEEVLKSGWVASQAPGPVSVPLGAGGNTYTGRNFGNYRPATLAGVKYDDSNVNGEREVDEDGVEGWTISLSNGEQRSTDAEGAFSFSVRPGTYTLSELQQEGWRQTSPGEGGTHTFTVVSGQIVEGIEFGNVCLGDVSVAAVDDSTGEPVSMEVRLEEVSVPGILSNEPGLPRTAPGTPTDFGDLLPGTYRVVAFLPEGVYTTDPDVTPVEGRFAIVKEISVEECETTSLLLHTITDSTPDALVTGGVKIAVPEGFATGAFEFMTRKGEPRGTLQYWDHATGLNLHTSTIDLIHVDGEEALVWGHVSVGGSPQVFLLRLVDAGEPGTADRFELTLASGYEAGHGETLIGGNVQIHDK